MRLFWVCLGGAFGSGARYLLSGWVMEQLGPTFPCGTLAVNTIGSFLLGALMFLGIEAGALSPTVRLALTTGVMGGFTTYSTFSYETMRPPGRLPGAGASQRRGHRRRLSGRVFSRLGLAQWLAGPSL